MKKVTIIGMGMMGASLALALKRAGIAQSIGGVDTQPSVLETALQQRIIDSAATNIRQGVQDAEAVVFATPVCTVLELLPVLADLQYSGMVIDLGSTKQAICAVASNLPNIKFVGCHPMAGSEISGVRGADPALFGGAPVIITPTEDTDHALLTQVIELWEALGCRVTVMTPEEHDFSVALISHLPYVSAVVTMNAAAELAHDKPDVFALIAGGFRDTTRVSGGDPVMWRDICLTNRTYILKAITKLKFELDKVEQALAAQDSVQLQNIFQMAQQRRRTYILPAGKNQVKLASGGVCNPPDA